MTIEDTENKFFDDNQEHTFEQIATDTVQATTELCCSDVSSNVGNSTIDDNWRIININELARIVYEMKKKIDVLSEHFSFLFTPFDKSQQN